MKRNAIVTLLALITYLSYANASTNPWYDSAQVRIDNIRKGNFKLKVEDNNGTGVQDSVIIRHKKHEFPWGTAIDLTFSAGSTYTSAKAVTAKSDSEIYLTERYATYLPYLLPSEKGKKYKIIIKLSENYFTSANLRLFDVYVYGQKIMQNLDKYVLAGGEFKAFDTTAIVIAKDTVINLLFQSTKDNASIMGLVLCDSTGAPILRLNCGGPTMTTKSGNKYINDLAYVDKSATAPGTSADDWRKAILLKYCNYGVCGEQFKWGGIEPNEGQLNYAPFENTLSWFHKVGWDMRAHNLLWGRTSSTDYYEYPQWVHQLATTTLMYDTCEMRVTREVSRYKGNVKEYDVLNEPTHANYLQSKVGDSIDWNCFKWAHQADPNARLFVNDYNIIEYQSQTDNFVALVKKMLQNGAPVTGIGAQCHIGQSTDLVNFKTRFDELAQFGLPIKITEFDMNAGSISQQAQAIETAKMMRLAFSHPAIEGFIFWGLIDPGWAAGVENIINVDGTPRIVADTVYHLIHEVWATKINDMTDNAGNYQFKGYYGDYDVMVKSGNTWEKFIDADQCLLIHCQHDPQPSIFDDCGRGVVGQIARRLGGPDRLSGVLVQGDDAGFLSARTTDDSIAVDEHRFGQPPGNVRGVKLLQNVDAPDFPAGLGVEADNLPQRAFMVETLAVNGRGAPCAGMIARPSIAGWRLPLDVAVEVHGRDRRLAVDIAGNENQAPGDRGTTKAVADPLAGPEQLRAIGGPRFSRPVSGEILSPGP